MGEFAQQHVDLTGQNTALFGVNTF